MSQSPVPDLPLHFRLASSYAPRNSRLAIQAMLGLDYRLSLILQQNTEAMIAQLKLAWWRDRLGESPTNWPSGEPLLEALLDGDVAPSSYLALVNGWETLLADEVSLDQLKEFAHGRASAWQAIASQYGSQADVEAAKSIGSAWAYADLAIHLDNAEEANRARELALADQPSQKRLSRALRPLAVLQGLSQRTLRKNGKELLEGPAAIIPALRIGLIGR